MGYEFLVTLDHPLTESFELSHTQSSEESSLPQLSSSAIYTGSPEVRYSCSEILISSSHEEMEQGLR